MKTSMVNSLGETVSKELVFKRNRRQNPSAYGNPCLVFKFGKGDFSPPIAFPSFVTFFDPEGPVDNCPERIDEATKRERRKFRKWWKRNEKYWKKHLATDPAFEPYRRHPKPAVWLPPQPPINRP